MNTSSTHKSDTHLESKDPLIASTVNSTIKSLQIDCEMLESISAKVEMDSSSKDSFDINENEIFDDDDDSSYNEVNITDISQIGPSV